METDLNLITNAWQTEARTKRPAADKAVQAAIVPAGGNWQCVAPDGAITRSVVWNGIEVALVNPAGALDDHTEGQIAMALRAMPAADKALRCISILAQHAENIDIIRLIAVAAVDFIEQPAPAIREPAEEDEGEEI